MRVGVVTLLCLSPLMGGLVLADSEPDELAGTVEAHNYFRCLHGVPLIRWSDDLAESAQGVANTRKKESKCQVTQSEFAAENQLWTRAENPSGKEMSAAWYGEVSSGYKYNGGYTERTKHFTQLVWAGVVDIGCAFASCPDDNSDIHVCHYSQADIGSFSEQVPYVLNSAEFCTLLSEGARMGVASSEQSAEVIYATYYIFVVVAVIAVLMVAACVFKFTCVEALGSKFGELEKLHGDLFLLAIMIIIVALTAAAFDNGNWIANADGTTLSPHEYCSGTNGVCLSWDTLCNNAYDCHVPSALSAVSILLIIILIAGGLALVLHLFCILCYFRPDFPTLELHQFYGAAAAFSSIQAVCSFFVVFIWGGWVASFITPNEIPTPGWPSFLMIGTVLFSLFGCVVAMGLRGGAESKEAQQTAV